MAGSDYATNALINALAGSSGSSLIGYKNGFSGSVIRTQQSKNQESVSILDFGADPTNTTSSDAAVNSALASGAKTIIVPDGNYKITTGNFAYSDYTQITFQKNAFFKAAENNITFFKITTHAYFSLVHNANLDGNGFTNVVGFDLTNVRLQAAIMHPSCVNMNNAFILRGGCFGLMIFNPNTGNVPYPLQAIANCSGAEVYKPTFDNEVAIGGNNTGIGIDVQFGSGSNIGFRIVGGYVQGFATGIQDAAIATKIEDTYFEDNTTTDVYATAARNSVYGGTTHYGATGSSAFKLRNSDAVTIEWPTRGSGARTAVFDTDNTNTNCRAFLSPSNASLDYPIGTATGLLLSSNTQIFTVGDASGAGLVFTQNSNPLISISGNVATVTIDITYPTTANTSYASLSLPIAAKSGTPINGIVAYTNYGSSLTMNGTASSINVYNAAGAALQNSALSGKRISFTLSYIVN